jgi:hypothetical protein
MLNEQQRKELIARIRKGETIASICRSFFGENFTDEQYNICWMVAYEADEGSSRGNKWKITSRLNRLRREVSPELVEVVDEIDYCVQTIYERYRTSNFLIDTARKLFTE